MTSNELRDIVLKELAAIAPEAELTQLDADEDVREALDLDSMDVLRFATGLRDRLGVEVPESDYTRITRLRTCIEYLARRLDGPAPAPRSRT